MQWIHINLAVKGGCGNCLKRNIAVTITGQNLEEPKKMFFNHKIKVLIGGELVLMHRYALTKF